MRKNDLLAPFAHLQDEASSILKDDSTAFKLMLEDRRELMGAAKLNACQKKRLKEIQNRIYNLYAFQKKLDRWFNDIMSRFDVQHIPIEILEFCSQINGLSREARLSVSFVLKKIEKRQGELAQKSSLIVETYFGESNL